MLEIVNDADRPVMFIFSGKAHPADGGGQDLIRKILDIAKRPEFAGKVMFLENYNMEIAKLLVQGVDIWLNTPTRPKEASGTSGMKAAMNGVVNFSVLDGWWAEGYRPDAGWALTEKRTYQNQDLQNELDAETIYNILENAIVPTYYDRNKQGISEKWVGYVKAIIGDVAPHFTMKRMMDHYFERFYSKLAVRSKKVNAKDHRMARELNAWKNFIRERWDVVEMVDKDIYDTDNYALPLGKDFTTTIKLHIGDIPSEQVGVELVFFKREVQDNLTLIHREELKLVEQVNSIASYRGTIKSTVSGVFEYGIRVFPKHKMLPHQQDFDLVKWI